MLQRSFAMSGEKVFLGLDLSTQSASSLAITPDGKVVHRSTINFDEHLPSYGTTNGMIVKGSVVTSPAGMWLDALDLLFAQIDKDVLQKTAAISASAQQHGSVYWGSNGQHSLKNLDSSKSLKDNILGALVLQDCPIWADSSTEKQCRNFEEKLGGAKAVADITGTRAQHRFTGNQMAKIAEEQPDKWKACERVSLVSSFVSSLLIGDYAPIDISDGSGMNLMDFRSKKWHAEACKATAPDLPTKLGPDPIASSSIIGTVAQYWTDKFGLSPHCRVVCCSGDNPCSIVGMELQPGEVVISLGTSDTLMGISYDPAPDVLGTVMVHPTFKDAYFAMLVFKNGAVARTAVRDAVCNESWDEFERRLQQSAPGNGGKIALHILLDEITPQISAKGAHREDEDGKAVEEPFAPAEEVRGVVEGRMLSMKLHAREIGIRMPPSRVLVTGGTANNSQICKVVADVFGAEALVDAAAVGDTASLGAAMRARDAEASAGGSERDGKADEELGKQRLRGLTVVATPDMEATARYDALLERFGLFEERLAAMRPS